MGDALFETGWAVEDSVFEVFFFFLAERAEGAPIHGVPGGVGGKVAGAAPHLLDAAGKKAREGHVEVRLQRWGGVVRRRGFVETGPFRGVAINNGGAERAVR